MVLNEERLRKMVYGGAVLGAGGGGTIRGGLSAGRRALAGGTPRLMRLNELPPEARLLTLSGVGTVSGDLHLGVDNLDWHRWRAWELFRRADPRPIAGFLPSEVGPLAVTYGWRESAVTGIPVVDAPCNGRAHPLGVMGSLGLHRRPGHITTTVAVGGQRGTPAYLELWVKANVRRASRMVRDAVSSMGFSFGVVRNPLSAAYVSRHAAVGGLQYAWRVGGVLLRCLPIGIGAVLKALSQFMRGRVLVRGRISSTDVRDRSGLTVGTLVVSSDVGDYVRILVCNEFMMAMQGGRPLAAFPDLITVFDCEASLPLATADIQVGRQVAVFAVPARHLRLASTMYDRSLLRPIESLLRIRFPAREAPPAPNAETAEVPIASA